MHTVVNKNLLEETLADYEKLLDLNDQLEKTIDTISSDNDALNKTNDTLLSKNIVLEESNNKLVSNITVMRKSLNTTYGLNADLEQKNMYLTLENYRVQRNNTIMKGIMSVVLLVAAYIAVSSNYGVTKGLILKQHLDTLDLLDSCIYSKTDLLIELASYQHCEYSTITAEDQAKQSLIKINKEYKEAGAMLKNSISELKEAMGTKKTEECPPQKENKDPQQKSEEEVCSSYISELKKQKNKLEFLEIKNNAYEITLKSMGDQPETFIYLRQTIKEQKNKIEEQKSEIVELEHTKGECNVDLNACNQKAKQYISLDKHRVEMIKKYEDKFETCNESFKQCKNKNKKQN